MKVTPKKALGQNFLTSKNIAKKIVDLLGSTNGYEILEIGPGMGVLTDFLLQSKQKLTAIELDTRAVEYLSNKYSNELATQFNIVNTDFLKFNIEQFSIASNKKLKIIGNIPYNISTVIFFQLFENAKYIERAVLTVQKEVARRVSSPPNSKERGIMSLAREMTSKSKVEFDISGGSFYPAPKVTSSVISLDFFDEQYPIEKYKALMQLVRAAFGQRRKVMKNSLNSYLASINTNIAALEEELSKSELNYLKMRAEQLSLSDFESLYGYIIANRQK